MPRQLHDHEINDFNRAHMKVAATDGPGPGGASHEYVLFAQGGDGNVHGDIKIVFQNGPVKEAGVNGITDEALYAVLIDRLRAFQSGPYACRENAVALTHLERALLWQHKRTLDRERRGVEGTHQQ